MQASQRIQGKDSGIGERYLKLTIRARFHDLTWVDTGDDHKTGVIAGALESGALDVWDADKLISDKRYSCIFDHLCWC